jgi:hypothetical protein
MQQERRGDRVLSVDGCLDEMESAKRHRHSSCALVICIGGGGFELNRAGVVIVHHLCAVARRADAWQPAPRARVGHERCLTRHTALERSARAREGSYLSFRLEY